MMTNTQIMWINPLELKTRYPFCNIFTITQSVLEDIQCSMAQEGYDTSKPIDVWEEDNAYTVIDGHTRLKSALDCQIEKVPIYVHEFNSEADALRYAFQNQKNRRNATGAEILLAVSVLDSRKPEGRPSEETRPLGLVSGTSSQATADLIGTSERTVRRARTILDHADLDTKEAVLSGEKTINRAYEETQERRKALAESPDDLVLTPPHPVENRTSEPKTPTAIVYEEQPALTYAGVIPLIAKGSTTVPSFNRTNDNVEWALWTWNPVTGCLHDCPYCYARDIANRFYPQKFVPTFHPDRLKAPQHTKVPDAAKSNIGEKNVFVCSMADLWGKWVPTEWIEQVLQEVRNAPQWNFLFLTKFPARYEEFAGNIPDNAWIGTTVDKQHAVQRAEKAFKRVMDAGHKGIRWLSCEPMLERLTFNQLNMFHWVVIGGGSPSSQTPETHPNPEWVFDLSTQAKTANCKIYWKTNLFWPSNLSRDGDFGRWAKTWLEAVRIREYPWTNQKG